MATVPPAKLKAAAPDVQRFATRAAQLEKFRPIVTYWCEYYILQQILSRQLHTSDEECTQYAVQLMDKLESYKSTNAANDAVVDDVAAKAYIENFALETFNRADEAQRTNSVTKQTADTFQASATFMDLLTVWGQLEADIQAKQKFAKFHAVRIAKAIKAGEDPNASNPVVQPPPVPDAALDDGLEAELKHLENDAGLYRPPTVENVPDNGIPSRPQSITQRDPLQPPPAASPNILPPAAPQPSDLNVSPIESNNKVNSRAGSIGGGYFPAIPDRPGNINAASPLNQPYDAPSTFATADPANFYNNTAPPSAPTPGDLGITSSSRPAAPTPQQMASQPPASPPAPTSRPVTHAPVPVQNPQRFAQSVNSAPPPGSFNIDDDSVMAAQKHAKWAISALNFEDVSTAVKELRIALKSLGAD